MDKNKCWIEKPFDGNEFEILWIVFENLETCALLVYKLYWLLAILYCDSQLFLTLYKYKDLIWNSIPQKSGILKSHRQMLIRLRLIFCNRAVTNNTCELP